MAKYIIELPDGVTLETICAVIAHHQSAHRILAGAREAVETKPFEPRGITKTVPARYTIGDKPVTLYAVEAP